MLKPTKGGLWPAESIIRASQVDWDFAVHPKQ
jgi:hypothetical protein